MPVTLTLSDVLEGVQKLSIKDQKSVIAVIRQRIKERRRKALIKSVQEAREEYRQGKGRTMTVEEFMREIQS